MKNERGITLIALVITIIVMLILVTVTIRVATDGKLFTHAANAVKDTKTAIAGENAILNDELDKSIEEIVAEQTTEPVIIHFTIQGYDDPFTAIEGMTWAQWVANNKYNTAGFYIDGDHVKTGDGLKIWSTPPEGFAAAQRPEFALADGYAFNAHN